MQETAKAFHVVVNLDELIVQGGIGDRCQMKDRVEFLVAELLAPIEGGQVLGHEIAAVTRQILEIAGAEIVNHGQANVRHSFLESEDEIGADEAGAACDENGINGRHANWRGEGASNNEVLSQQWQAAASDGAQEPISVKINRDNAGNRSRSSDRA